MSVFQTDAQFAQALLEQDNAALAELPALRSKLIAFLSSDFPDIFGSGLIEEKVDQVVSEALATTKLSRKSSKTGLDERPPLLEEYVDFGRDRTLVSFLALIIKRRILDHLRRPAQLPLPSGESSESSEGEAGPLPSELISRSENDLRNIVEVVRLALLFAMERAAQTGLAEALVIGRLVDVYHFSGKEVAKLMRTSEAGVTRRRQRFQEAMREFVLEFLNRVSPREVWEWDLVKSVFQLHPRILHGDEDSPANLQQSTAAFEGAAPAVKIHSVSP